MLDIIKTSRWPYLLTAIIASFVEGSLFCLVVFSFLTSGIQVTSYSTDLANDVYTSLVIP